MIQILDWTKSNPLLHRVKIISFQKGKNIIYRHQFVFYNYFRLQFTLTALRKKIKEKKPNGGWGDKRDHELCMKFTLANDKGSNKSKKQ